jgi:two-component system response regulator LytT
MKIVIIEDERNTADDLEETILYIEPSAQIVKKLHSVAESLAYFSKNIPPDLLFCDIQLGDGTSFEILSKANIRTPTIFCTAYDEYALNAFETHSIDYIMKPFDRTTVGKALKKFKELKDMLSPVNHNLVLELLAKRSRVDDRMLVRYKDKILPIAYSDIALFYLENELIQLITNDNKSYFVQKTLDELERDAGESFYRVNRQFIINKDAIKDVSTSLTRTISVNLKLAFSQKITVSRNRAVHFLEWLI